MNLPDIKLNPMKDVVHPGFTINTDVYNNGTIMQSMTDLVGVVSKRVIDTQDIQIKQALISLGWTPPKGEN